MSDEVCAHHYTELLQFILEFGILNTSEALFQACRREDRLTEPDPSVSFFPILIALLS